ncbi:hypothetical protein BRC77_11755 [Halobacteriales archaeon QH_8_64_26]|nr:MAG: hypothetical protein BRC77_11755 [Halobacteriales archaeon QH_8_64_26]
MEVRDAVEDDAPRLAELTGAPASVMRELVHDRTTKVATSGSDVGNEADREDGSRAASEAAESEDVGNAELTEGNGGELVGVVSFDARRDSVHLTQLAGSERAVSRLLDEPIRFARREDMAVEVLIEEERGDLQEAVGEAGFERAGSGPEFDGRETISFRLDP